MTNRFFNNPFSPPLFSLGRSTSLKRTYDDVAAGFTSVQAELDALGSRGSRFEDLANVPASLADKPNQYLRINVAGTSIEAVPGGRVGLITLSGASNTLQPVHAGNQLLVSHTSETQLVVETNAVQTFGQGDVVLINQRGEGQVNIAPASGVTVRSTDNLMKTRTQHANVALVYLGSDEWLLIGERNAAALGFASLYAPNIFSGQQSVTPATLVDGVSIAVDASLSNTFLVTLGGNRTIANPTNMANGAVYNFHITQDGTGGRTLSWGNKFKFANNTPPTLTTTAGKTDLISGQYLAAADVIRMGALLKSYD